MPLAPFLDLAAETLPGLAAVLGRPSTAYDVFAALGPSWATRRRSSSSRMPTGHAWIWKHNPRGMFDDWNPRVQCPA